MSFLELEGLHVFVTGAVGGIGSAIVDEFLTQGCKVTAHDKRPNPQAATPSFYSIQGDISDESSIALSIAEATSHFGPINILCANAGITDESSRYSIWDMPTDLWDRIYAVNVRGTFLTIKHFIKSVEQHQTTIDGELGNVAVVVTGSECGVFGQAGHAEYASGKAALQYGLVKTVKNEIVRLNGKARINAVAPGWVDTPLIEGRLDDPNEMWREAEATVPLRKIARPTDVARAAAFLASHRAAGHITGQCISVDGGMEGRIVWTQDEVQKASQTSAVNLTWDARSKEKSSSEETSSSKVESLPKEESLSKDESLSKESLSEDTSLSKEESPPKYTSLPKEDSPPYSIQSISAPSTNTSKSKIKVLISVDFDAVSGWLGTGQHPDNNLADYSSGFFSAYVGVPRLLKLFKKMGISEQVTWFVPMHSAESFPDEFKQIVESGCEIGLHGYCHEGAPQLTPAQEREVLEHCIDVCTALTGRKPTGYRAPLYQLRESTIALLEEHAFLYDSSLSHHDSKPYYIPRLPAITAPIYSPSASARSWMKPLPPPQPPTSTTLVEVPGNWYAEDMTPLQYWPHTANSQGYVDVRVVEQMWKDKFEWMRGELGDVAETEAMVFPLVLHPDTSGMAHVIGMVQRVLEWLKGQGEVEFCTFESVAAEWRGRNAVE